MTATGALTITVDDDMPVFNRSTNLFYANGNNDGAGPLTGGSGVYDFDVGADIHTGTWSAINSDFASITLSGTVGSASIVNVTQPTWTSESATNATFTFSFQYAANPTQPSVLSTSTGTITFDKVAGTYTVELNAPIQSFSTFSTSNGSAFQGYIPNSNTFDNTQPDVAVTTIASDFYIQFTGDNDNLLAGTNNAYVNGEIITGDSSWVSVSGSASGVASDTLQAEEVLDFNFYQTNPTGFLPSANPVATASSMYLRLDGYNTGEDMVVILKLFSATLGTTTKAVVVSSADVYVQGDTIPAGFSSLPPLDSNDGLVIIESNDFNAAGQDYVITGAQLMVSTENITGSGINLNRATGASGGSTGTNTFGSDTDDNDVIKISDIGIVTQSTSTLNANLNFNVTNADADGDSTVARTLSVTIGGTTLTGTSANESLVGSTSADILTGGGGADIISGGDGTDVINLNLAGDGSIPDTDRDVVKFDASALGEIDTINDFLIGTGATSDVIDLSDMFVVTPAGGGVAGYVQVVNDQLQVDANGGGNSFQTIATITGRIEGQAVSILFNNNGTDDTSGSIT